MYINRLANMLGWGGLLYSQSASATGQCLVPTIGYGAMTYVAGSSSEFGLIQVQD